MKHFFCLAAILVLVSVSVVAQQQDLKLAQQYFQRGEFEKATPLFEKLYNQSPLNSYFYRNYLKCLISLDEFKSAEKLIKKYEKKKKNDLTPRVDLGFLYKQQERHEEAERMFEQALGNLKNAPNQVRSLANAFNTAGEGDYVIETYKQGRKLEKDEMTFSFELARAYKNKGEYEEMISYFLDYMITHPGKTQYIKNEFQKIIGFEELNESLQSQLYRRIQNYPEANQYTDMLVWVFIQNKDFESAFVQVQALDRRNKENGQRVFSIAELAEMEGQYDAAISGYQYVVDKGEMNSMYEPARMKVLECKMNKITETNTYTPEDLTELEVNFLELLQEIGKIPPTAPLMLDLSHLYAFYLHDIQKAIDLLEEVVIMPSISQQLRAHCKLDLGDFYIIAGDVWEATLYYSQVDKDFKDDILGEEARFRNAKLSYYNGDFEWAQGQLKVLKASTSELIANDALELSVFIMDNMGLDTSATAMEMYARADLLLFQNKISGAYQVLDSLEQQFPGHFLADDILYIRGKIAHQQRDFEQAVFYFEKVYTEFPEDILADDSVYKLAEIYQYQLPDEEKAMNYYQDIIVNYPGSLYTVEARKRFRKLRGDEIN